MCLSDEPAGPHPATTRGSSHSQVAIEARRGFNKSGAHDTHRRPAHDRQVLGKRLRDQHPIKWVLGCARQQPGAPAVLDSDRKLFKTQSLALMRIWWANFAPPGNFRERTLVVNGQAEAALTSTSLSQRRIAFFAASDSLGLSKANQISA